MRHEDRDAAYLWDMREALRSVRTFIAGKTLTDFLGEELLQSAVIRQLTVLGEAASRVSTDLRNRHPQIPWRTIVGLRNVVVHQYDKVEPADIWLIATNDARALVEQLDPLIPPLPVDRATPDGN
jgi:uncharacterized protein with HEPN domain